MIIGHHANIELKLHVGFLMIGEGAIMGEDVVSDGDIRADMWCRFEKTVKGGGDAYLGEFTVINGKITVEGDLDVGKNVKLNGGFLSKGWIVVRNSLPLMVFIYIYIRELIGIGKTNEEIDKALNDLFQDDEIDIEKLKEANISDILNHGGFFIVPVGSKFSKDAINTPENAVVGKNCRIEGNLYCSRFEGGPYMTYTGFLKSKGDIWLAEGTKFNGTIHAPGKLIVGRNVNIVGNISAKAVVIHETSRVVGKISCGNIRVAIGDDFDLKDHDNKEKIFSKSNSFDRLSEIYVVKEFANVLKIEETEDEDESKTEQTKTTENDVEETVNAESPESKKTKENEEDSNGASEDVQKDAPKSRRQQRRATKSKKSKEDIAIVNVFTGENIEKPEEREEVSGSK
ncbi:MAG: polymer-forming cytoskeletal protein [Methanimicrococcus sp.]|nr:polymer-forming cytoskeletal protein [Methanimicrococcus sp.]